MNRADMRINPIEVRRVLAGEVKSLWYAFLWEATPQGRSYWVDRSFADVALTDEDRAFLESLLEDGE